MDKQRINKYLASTGLGSRRSVEDLISSGKVKVNGVRVTDLSTMIDPETDKVECSGVVAEPAKVKYYLMLHKPKGYLTTLKDPENRPIVMDLLPSKFRRSAVVPVGRLDKDTEGLLILTNDGDLAYALTHPKFNVHKEYHVVLDKPLEDAHRMRIEKGVIMYGKKTNPARVSFPDKFHDSLILTISEGKKRQIRITFKIFNYKVRKLKRIAIGPVRLSGVASGMFRPLTSREVTALKKYIVNGGFVGSKTS